MQFEFEAFVLDERTRELRRDGLVIDLEARPFDLLADLLHHAGEVVTKAELIERVWQGRVVTEGVLGKAVTKIRAALDDEDQRILRTIHGIGLRLQSAVKAQPAGDATDVPVLPELKPGASLPQRPHWQLERPLAGGGFGEVWLARHAMTRAPRVFKFARDVRELTGIKREITFARTLRDSLGTHGAFVALLDWNLDQPPFYLELEFASGGSLDAWLDGHWEARAPDATARVALIASVAEAVALAHSVGVLHKDLKPGNVLIQAHDDGRTEVKLADFGSARLLDPQVLEALRITRLGLSRTHATGSDSGTVLYLAPEVLSGGAATVRSDVYALGVMLYQILVGDFRRLLAPGWERDIDDPLLREDIAAATDGDPARRLGSAAELAQRLRHLEARRQQRAQAELERVERAEAARRGERQTRRLRMAAALSAVLALAVLVSLHFFNQARVARENAEAALVTAQREADISAAINRFLNEDLIGAADPYAGAARDRPIGELIEEALPRVDLRLGDQSAIAGEVLRSLGQALIGLGRLESAESALDAAVGHLDAAHGAGDPRSLEARLVRALVENAAQRNQAFADRLQGLLPDASHLDASHPTLLRILNSHAWAPFSIGDFGAALERFDAAIARVEGHPEVAQSELANLHWGKALALSRLGRPAEALPAAERGLVLRRNGLGEDAVLTWLSEAQVANLMVALDRADAALPQLAHVYRRMQERFGPDHNQSVGAAHEYGLALLNAGQPEAAVEPLQDARRGKSVLFGPLAGSTMTSGAVLAAALTQSGRFDEAEALFREYEAFEPRNAYDRRSLGSLLRNRAEYRLLRDQPAAARADCEQALAITRELVAESHPMYRASEACLGIALARLGEHSQAAELIGRQLPALQEAGRPAARLVQRMREVLPLLGLDADDPAALPGAVGGAD